MNLPTIAAAAAWSTGFMLAACTNALQEPAGRPPNAPVVNVVVRSEPVTVEVPLPATVAARIRTLGQTDRDRALTIRLTLEDVTAERDSGGIRVFVGRLAGTPSVDGPYFVGTVTFGHSGPFEKPPTDSFLLNIAPALRALPGDRRLIEGARGPVLPITLALRPSERAAAMSAVTVKRVLVSLHEPQ
jgi:hypothetical protein